MTVCAIKKNYLKVNNNCVFVYTDVASNRKLLAMLLMQKGIGRVDFAEDGLKGVEQVRSKGFDCYDLIFMDNTMPTMVKQFFSKALLC